LAPALCHFDPEKKVVIKTHAFNLTIVGVLSQYIDDGILHLVAYFSREQSPTEIYYKIYNKGLLTIFYAFKEWCPLLEGFSHTIEVISDHQSLMYFTTNHLLNYP
jgi:hypothetical protein